MKKSTLPRIRYVLYRGAKYASMEDMRSTQEVPIVTMQELFSENYLKKIEDLDKRLKHFGWTIMPTVATKKRESLKVVVMRLEDRMKHTYDTMGEAVHALYFRIKDPKFHELVYPAFSTISAATEGGPQ